MRAHNIMQLVDQGTGAMTRGNSPQARHCFLSAARELMMRAKGAKGDQREQQISQANRLIQHAARLGTDALTPDIPVNNDSEESDDSFGYQRGNSVRLDDVAGLEEVKRSFLAKFIYPMHHPEKAARYNQSGGGGMLLYGPPGTGKTFLARALAGELNAPVFTIKPSEIMSKYVGEAEQNIAQLFDDARKHPLSVIFIDEIDAIAPSRQDDSPEVMKRLVTQLLSELDGFEKNSNRLIFIGATNEPWSLDPALMRAGRFDELGYVGLPNAKAREKILQDHLQDVYLDNTVTAQKLAELTEGYSGADLFGLCITAPQYPYIESCESGSERPVNMADFELALGQRPPSVTEAILEKYEAFNR